ncbi:hypothetical protein PI125_g25653 [Phytophthora idaei]|nr:hypothetical protein PI125_g25653 [Phytophthora idaei]KAG3142713.1 hypothetical protein PI126_g14924 [Phytophthora idaei]
MEATTLVPVVTLPHSSNFTPGPTMTNGGLNRAIDRAFMALAPRRTRERERLQVCYPIFTFNPRPCAHHLVSVSVNLVRATLTIQTLSKDAAPPALPGTSAPMNPAPASPAPSEAPPALPAATEVPAEPPAAPLVPDDASAPVTEASLQAMLAESSEASVDQMMTSMLPYVTAIVRHQVQLHVSPPLHTDVAAQRRLSGAVGFDDVLAAVHPLPDSLPDLPRQIGELEARIRSAEADAAAAKRSVVPQMLARESAEQLLKISSSKVESLDAENKRLGAANIRVDALLQKMKESTDLHTQDLELARAEVAERDVVIHALKRRLAKEREVFKAAVAANTEQTRQLHAILIKAQKGKFVDADTAHSLEDIQERNTHLLHINRVLRSHVSLAGMDPEILVLALQGAGRPLMPPLIAHLLTFVRHDW